MSDTNNPDTGSATGDPGDIVHSEPVAVSPETRSVSFFVWSSNVSRAIAASIRTIEAKLEGGEWVPMSLNCMKQAKCIDATGTTEALPSLATYCMDGIDCIPWDYVREAIDAPPATDMGALSWVVHKG